MMRARAGVAGLLLAVMVFVTGCNPFVTHRSIGVDASEVSVIEFYEYAWGEDLETVKRLTLDSDEVGRELIDEWVDGYTGMPTTGIGQRSIDDASGKQAQSVRFILSDGTAVEVTTIFLGYHDVLVIWPDGTANHTEWGAPDLLDYYSEFGVVEQVDADERPQAELPG